MKIIKNLLFTVFCAVICFACKSNNENETLSSLKGTQWKRQMKKTFLLMMLFVFALTKPVNAQNVKIGITATPLGENDILMKNLMGGPSYSGAGFYTFGISSQIPISSLLDIETGIDYSRHTIKISSSDLYPNTTIQSYKSNVKLASIPVTLKLNFLKYFFVNGGFLLDIDASNSSLIDKQTGIGALAGIGIKYDFNFGGTLFINPEFKYHSLLPFSSSQNRQRLIETGIRIGIMFNLSGKTK